LLRPVAGRRRIRDILLRHVGHRRVVGQVVDSPVVPLGSIGVRLFLHSAGFLVCGLAGVSKANGIGAATGLVLLVIVESEPFYCLPKLFWFGRGRA
jgi:hypothetical protein